MHTGLRTLHLGYVRNEQHLFQGLALRLEPGQGLLICGPNGAGKTTLLRVLAGLIPPTAGSVLWQGKCLEEERLAYHQSLHYLGHLSGVKNKLSVKENLRYSETLLDQRLDEARQEAILQALQLQAPEDRLACQLSAGQKRRLALARLLAFSRPLWILDEPFTNLDVACQQWFSEQIEVHLQNGGMVILASHQAPVFKRQEGLRVLTLPRDSGNEQTESQRRAWRMDCRAAQSAPRNDERERPE